MSEPYLGQIIMFGGNFAINGWAMCNGQLLSIQQYTALFSILGTTFGGDGIRTFGLPDLRGRVPIHQGQGPGLSPYVLGQISGTETVTLLNNQMPMHNHLINVDGATVTGRSPVNSFLGTVLASQPEKIYSTGPATATMNPAAVSMAGGSQPHSNLQPYLCVTYLIALNGIFPSRN